MSLALLFNLRPESPAAIRDKVQDLLVFRARMFCIPLTEAAYVTASVQAVRPMAYVEHGPTTGAVWPGTRRYLEFLNCVSKGCGSEHAAGHGKGCNYVRAKRYQPEVAVAVVGAVSRPIDRAKIMSERPTRASAIIAPAAVGTGTGGEGSGFWDAVLAPR
jgi:hypothetical protein